MKNFIVLLFLALFIIGCTPKKNCDLLLINGKIWTGDKSFPWANWISVKGSVIHRVGSDDQTPPKSLEVIDLEGNLVVPGFNDSHVHFASAGNLLLGINLLDVNSDTLMVRRLKETMNRLPEGSWITGGDWGAYEAWSLGSSGTSSKEESYLPNRKLIDSISQDYPVLLTRYDRKIGLANFVALDYYGLESEDGLLEGELLTSALAKIPEKSIERKIAEAQRALRQCSEMGVTTVQDMSPMNQLEVYDYLHKKGELSCRINFSPSRLSDYKLMKENNWVINYSNENNPIPAGDEWLRFGTLKTHIDGIMGGRSARFYEPYSDNEPINADWRGGWREFSQDMPNFKRMILAADSANIQLRIHAIGDEANSILLDIVDTMEIVNGPRDRRFRIVHAQVIEPKDFTRFKGKNIVAEVQPYHVTDDMRWMEERIGHERCKGAYAFKTLIEHGCILSFGSDWPGTNASYYPINPLYGLFAAVTRQTINGEPKEGWFPEERISLEEALKAYTWGSAFGAFEENEKGTIERGKLADITVLDTDLFNTEPKQWLEAKILYTIVGGNIVYQLN